MKIIMWIALIMGILYFAPKHYPEEIVILRYSPAEDPLHDAYQKNCSEEAIIVDYLFYERQYYVTLRCGDENTSAVIDEKHIRGGKKWKGTLF